MQAASFWRGFRLPFELIVATLRDAELRAPFVRLFVVRAAIVGALFAAAASNGEFSKQKNLEPHVTVRRDGDGTHPAEAVNVDLPGLHLHLDSAQDAGAVQILGRDVPIDMGEAQRAADDRAAEEQAGKDVPDTVVTRVVHRAKYGWKWLLAAVTFVSVMEGLVVFFSRRWDDWLSHHGARLAGIVPEEDDPKPRKLAMEFRWLYRKSKRKIRGYLQFAIGLPLLLPLQAIPGIGPYVFGAFAAVWGWYWLGVFTAGKSAHAWGETHASPIPVRVFTNYVPQRGYAAPVRWYGRAMYRVTRDSHAAAVTFERDPAAFLGLALARAFLAAPFVYLLARPIVPLAAGRLCAEADPERRLFAPSPALNPA